MDKTKTIDIEAVIEHMIKLAEKRRNNDTTVRKST